MPPSVASCPPALAPAPRAPLPKPYTASVGPPGGTIVDPAGRTLEFPAGALASAQSIAVTTYTDTIDLGTAHADLAGALLGVKLEPDLELGADVTLRLVPYAPLAPGEYPLYWYDADAAAQVQTGHAVVDAAGTSVEATISHFSTYSVFDMPYDVLDDFDDLVADRGTEYPEAQLGNLYGSLYIDEEESFVGPDQYYGGCCYMRAGAEITIQYTVKGNPHAGYWEAGTATDKSYEVESAVGTLDVAVVPGEVSYAPNELYDWWTETYSVNRLDIVSEPEYDDSSVGRSSGEQRFQFQRPLGSGALVSCVLDGLERGQDTEQQGGQTFTILDPEAVFIKGDWVWIESPEPAGDSLEPGTYSGTDGGCLVVESAWAPPVAWTLVLSRAAE